MLGKLAELFIFGLAPLVFGGLMIPGAFAAEEVTIAGEVFYRERIALPPNAVLTVRLMDVSLADAPASIIAEQKIDPAGQVPIKFQIKVNPAVIQPNVNYALQARITVDDTLWFTNDERYAIDPLKPQPVQNDTEDGQAERRGRANRAVRHDLVGGRHQRQGGACIDDAQSTFSVTPEGKVTGSGGCNRFCAGRGQGRQDQDRKSRRHHDGLPRGAHGSGAEVPGRPGGRPQPTGSTATASSSSWTPTASISCGSPRRAEPRPHSASNKKAGAGTPALHFGSAAWRGCRTQSLSRRPRCRRTST